MALSCLLASHAHSQRNRISRHHAKYLVAGMCSDNLPAGVRRHASALADEGAQIFRNRCAFKRPSDRQWIRALCRAELIIDILLKVTGVLFVQHALGITPDIFISHCQQL